MVVDAARLGLDPGDVSVLERYERCRRFDGLALAETLSRIAPGLAVPEDAVIAGMVRPSQQEWERFAAACDALRSATAA